jgi:hypothetical protein
LLPAGAIAGWGLHPLESAAFARRTPGADFGCRGTRASAKSHEPKRHLATRGLLNLRSQRIPKSKHLSGRGLITAERGLHENKL